VTGLVVHNTGTYWSTFGHGVLAVLIQIGGLGVITVAITFSLLSGKKIGLRTRDLMQNAIGAPQLGGIIRFTRFLLLFTLLAESAGAFLLAPGFIRRYGVGNGIAKSFFHSISAFCNAGFDTLDKNGTFASLTRYSADLVVNLVIMLLIIIGGLGFFTWKDLIRNRFRWKNLKMQTRLILTTTALLILVPAIVFFFFQFTQGSLKERILMSLFQSVTTRTAGFNTADIGSLKEGSRLIIPVDVLRHAVHKLDDPAGRTVRDPFSSLQELALDGLKRQIFLFHGNHHILYPGIGFTVQLYSFSGAIQVGLTG
jgi:trk system potassium uptake protein TrkH